MTSGGNKFSQESPGSHGCQKRACKPRVDLKEPGKNTSTHFYTAGPELGAVMFPICQGRPRVWVIGASVQGGAHRLPSCQRYQWCLAQTLLKPKATGAFKWNRLSGVSAGAGTRHPSRSLHLDMSVRLLLRSDRWWLCCPDVTGQGKTTQEGTTRVE